MMNRYVYSLVRCVPDPRTGEFVNVAAIAGDPDTGDWSLRQVSDPSRARRLAGATAPTALGAVHRFLADVGGQIDSMQELMLTASADLLTEKWLNRLHHDHRNVVQLSTPTPILAEDAEDALDVLFSSQIIDPVAARRGKAVTRQTIMSELLRTYRRAHVDPVRVHRRVDLIVGDRVHTSLDFAIANGTTVQISQGWSFQGTQVDDVAEQVKAWAYALNLLRAGTQSLVMSEDWTSDIPSNVDLQVVVAPPGNPQQARVYDEAEQVFTQIDATIHTLDDVTAVGLRAAELLQGHPGQTHMPYDDHS